MAKLIAETGAFAGAEYDLGKPATVLGRLKSNDIEVADTKASRKHTQVTRGPEGWVVEDLGSSNGTFLNGAKVTRAVLKPGDKISIGQTVYRFVPDAPGATRAAAPSPAPSSVPRERAGASAKAGPPSPVAAPKPQAPPAPKPSPPSPLPPPPSAAEPEELSLEEPEELGLDAPAAARPPAAPAVPPAPRAPTPAAAPAPSPPAAPAAAARPGPATKPVVGAGNRLVSLAGPGPRSAPAGLFGEDLGQRDWRFQLLVYGGALLAAGGLAVGAYLLFDSMMGAPEEPIPVAPAGPAGRR